MLTQDEIKLIVDYPYPGESESFKYGYMVSLLSTLSTQFPEVDKRLRETLEYSKGIHDAKINNN